MIITFMGSMFLHVITAQMEWNGTQLRRVVQYSKYKIPNI